MSSRNTVVRSLHDLGAAAWFGGSLMGAVGVNGAAGTVRDPQDRARVASVGWAKWAPVNAAAIGAQALAALVQEQHRFAEAERLYQRALGIFENAYEPVHYELAVNYNNLAAVYAARGNPYQAEELYRRALDIKNQLLGPTHPDVAVSLHNVAMLAVGQGDDDRARELFERAVAILEASLGAEHPKTVTSRTQLAALPPRQPATDDIVVQRDSTTR